SVPSTCAAARPSAVTSSGLSSRFASPRMPSVPNSSVMSRRRPPGRLPLRVLGRLASLLQAVLAALLLARVTDEQAGLLEHGSQLVIERDQRAGDAEPQRARLPTDPATGDARLDVVHVGRLADPQRLGRGLAVGADREVLIDRAPVDEHLTGAGAQPHAGDGLLATPRGLDQW